jgi:hypothetical protein
MANCVPMLGYLSDVVGHRRFIGFTSQKITTWIFIAVKKNQVSHEHLATFRRNAYETTFRPDGPDQVGFWNGRKEQVM